MEKETLNKAASWLVNGETGISSKYILAVAMGYIPDDKTKSRSYPHDPSDFNRCHNLLLTAPGIEGCFSELKTHGPVWQRLIENWEELTHLREEEFPSGSAPKLYDRMQQLIDPEQYQKNQEYKAEREKRKAENAKPKLSIHGVLKPNMNNDWYNKVRHSAVSAFFDEYESECFDGEDKDSIVETLNDVVVHGMSGYDIMKELDTYYSWGFDQDLLEAFDTMDQFLREAENRMLFKWAEKNTVTPAHDLGNKVSMKMMGHEYTGVIKEVINTAENPVTYIVEFINDKTRSFYLSWFEDYKVIEG